MYATIRNYAGNPAMADRLVDKQDEIKRLVSEIEGFNAYYVIRTADGTASVTVYDDRAGAEESNRVAAAWVGENLPDLGDAAPQISAGEVAFSI